MGLTKVSTYYIFDEKLYYIYETKIVMRIIAIGIICFLILSFKGEREDKVFVCISPDAPVYHFDKYCRGLARCSHQIIITSRTEAINKYNRRLCGYED
jgi:hypothetical protein